MFKDKTEASKELRSISNIICHILDDLEFALKRPNQANLMSPEEVAGSLEMIDSLHKTGTVLMSTWPINSSNDYQGFYEKVSNFIKELRRTNDYRKTAPIVASIQEYRHLLRLQPSLSSSTGNEMNF